MIICDFWTERSHISHSSDTTPHTLLPRRKSLLSLLIKLLKFIIAGQEEFEEMYIVVEHANLSDAFYTRVNCLSDRHAQKGL